MRPVEVGGVEENFPREREAVVEVCHKDIQFEFSRMDVPRASRSRAVVATGSDQDRIVWFGRIRCSKNCAVFSMRFI